MQKKSLVLTFIAIALITVFFLLPETVDGQEQFMHIGQITNGSAIRQTLKPA